ncbi:hypothetical protein L226DRAFT_529551 [Lentinus tigrinus ALCF2SS1-7]|uniref:Bromo domain-containing protein n=1 Tax=Lentinus tigrinus ALCF2SS1-6 TaxID=1328759 RepID=A0A5C2SUL3_9APHY|nr:hypothetical protein L227DRAFT_569349 [Lentinus tigrinus ALCF2SS1-6]RPD81106.1 hypothetical protein L226DRAFT_529551 [Lentinus tigrinus ALCF2SS1-7]
MSSAVRSQKATSTPELDASNLTNVERLIFAQAVHEFGSNAWQEVAKLLSTHPLISQPKGTFTPQSCSTLYKHLMEEAGLEWSEEDTAPRSERHLRLAQKYYVARVTELRELIAAEEAKFKQLVTEIDEIRSGAWDDRIRESLGAPEPAQSVEAPPPKPSSPEAVAPPAREPEEVAVTEEPPQAIQEAQAEEEEESIARDDVVEPTPNADAEEKEEGSDNEAVNKLIGHYESDKPMEEVPEEPPVPVDQPPTAQPQEDEMQVDQEPVKEEEEEADEAHEASGEATPAAEEADVEDSPEVQPSPPPEPGPSTRAEGKRKASDADVATLEGQREKKRQREESEPAEDDEGAPRTRRKERAGDKRFQNMIGMLHSQISQHRYGNIFHNPIKKSEAPDYHDIVKRPMDLKTIKSRVKDGLISNSLEFQRDIYLMFANAMMYNRPGSEIYNMAEEMMSFSEREINAFRQTEGFHRL